MTWKQAILYTLCICGIYLSSFGAYLLLIEELLRLVISLDMIRDILRLLFLVILNPYITYLISSLLPFAPTGLANPRFNDTPSIIEENHQGDNT